MASKLDYLQKYAVHRSAKRKERETTAWAASLQKFDTKVVDHDVDEWRNKEARSKNADRGASRRLALYQVLSVDEKEGDDPSKRRYVFPSDAGIEEEDEESTPMIVDGDTGRNLELSSEQVQDLLGVTAKKHSTSIGQWELVGGHAPQDMHFHRDLGDRDLGELSSVSDQAKVRLRTEATNTIADSSRPRPSTAVADSRSGGPRLLSEDLKSLKERVSQDSVRPDSSADLSPPRWRAGGDPDLSPPRRRAGGDPDLSPPRRRAGGDPDLSPPRRRAGGDPDLSPPRRRAGGDPDLSPPRRRAGGDPDLSPPRRGHLQQTSCSSSQGLEQTMESKSSRKSDVVVKSESRSDSSPSPRRSQGAKDQPNGDTRGDTSCRMLDGSSSGLLLRGSAPRERDDSDRSPLSRVKMEPGAGAKEMDDDDRLLMQNDAVVYRDKTGKKISKDEWLALQEKRKRKERKRNRRNDPAPELEWGGGLKQKADHEARLEEEKRLAAEPIARYDIDPTLDKELRQRSRWEDPMAGFANSEDEGDDVKSRNNDDPKAKATQDSPGPTTKKPQCRFPPPPNRFCILPGYRWDGVVRGNGYEERRLEGINQRRLDQQNSYVSCMADI